jgi:hypothetical protein
VFANVSVEKSEACAMLALERSSSGRRNRTVLVAALVTALVLIGLVPFSLAAPDQPSVEWSKTYGGLQADSIIQTSDGGYAFAGTFRSTAPPIPENQSYSYAVVLAKTDSSGNLLWQKTYGTDVFGGSNNAVSVVETRDSGYALFGEGGFIIKTDSEGNVQSSINVGLSGVRKGILTVDDSYVLVGNSQRDGESFAWLVKVDEQGNLLWNKTFTGGFTVNDVTQTADRGSAIVGSLKNNFWLAKLDSNSNLQWSETYTYGGTLDQHYVTSLAKTKDGGYILAGAGDWQASGGLVPWLIKVNSEGHEQWNLPYGHIQYNCFNSVVQTDDEGYLVALSYTADLIRMDTSGSEKWNVTYATLGNEENFEYYPIKPSLSFLIGTDDGGYAVIATLLIQDTQLTKISREPDLTAPIVYVSTPKNGTYDTNDIPLTFTVNEPASLISYSLDGQAEVAISGNTTLSGLDVGTHNITIYAKDSAGNIGTSQMIQFTVAARFPTELIVISLAIVAIVAVSFLGYFKRQKLSDCRKAGLKSFFKKQRLVAFASNRIVWTLIIIGLCFLLIFVQIFFPYFYYSSSRRNPNSPFKVGVSYVYEQDNIGQIYDEVSSIKNLGFNVIRVNMVCDSNNLNAYSNTLTEVFFSAIMQVNMKVALIINNHDSADDINYYLGRWGKDLAYIQILNEPDVASSWELGALFTDDEAGSRFEEVYNMVADHQLSAQRYTNFGPAFIARTNLPIKFSEKLDFVGFDIFMESFLTLSPGMIQFLHKITNKGIMITEFGMSTSDDAAQTDYIIKGLSLFKSMGLRGCWIVYWNSADNFYGIRGRLAEQKVGEWIAQNT